MRASNAKLLNLYKESQKAFQKSEGLNLQHKYAKLDGVVSNIHYFEIGEGKPLIIIHGAVSTGDSWTNIISLLKNNFHLYIIDLPGFGLSDKINYREVPSYREHIIQVMDSLMNSLDLVKASFIGNSLGGLWISLFALERPEKVDKIGYAGKPLGMDNDFPFIMQLFGVRGINKLLFKPSNFEETKKIHDQILVKDVSKLSSEYVQCMSYASMISETNFSQRTIFESLLKFLSGLRVNLLLDKEMKKIQQPTVFIWGEFDVHAPLLTANKLVSNMPNAKLELIKNAGHLPWLEEPKKVANIIVSFFK